MSLLASSYYYYCSFLIFHLPCSRQPYTDKLQLGTTPACSSVHDLSMYGNRFVHIKRSRFNRFQHLPVFVRSRLFDRFQHARLPFNIIPELHSTCQNCIQHGLPHVRLSATRPHIRHGLPHVRLSATRPHGRAWKQRTTGRVASNFLICLPCSGLHTSGSLFGKRQCV